MIFRLSTLILPSLILLLATFCYADHEVEVKTAPTFVDKTHQDISESLAIPSQWFDDFFQDPRLDEEPARTFLRLRGSIITEEGEKLSYDGKLKARLELPRLKRRFHLILSSEEDDLRDETLRDAWINQGLSDDNETTLALQYTQERSTQFSLTHKIRLNFDDGPNPHIISRVRYTIPVANESFLTLTQSIFWENSEGFGEESRIDYDIPISETKLVRATGNGLFSESSNGYEWQSLLQWLQSFSHKKAMAVGGYVVGETRPKCYVTEYDVYFKYRQRINKEWLFIEFKPEVKWTRENNFESVGIFTITLEAQFGE